MKEKLNFAINRFSKKQMTFFRRMEKRGINIKWILRAVKEIRASSEIPLVLMGYINPIIKYGLVKFLNF